MRDSQLYIPSSLRHKLSLIARKANQTELEREDGKHTADSIGTELLELVISQQYPEFAEAYSQKEDWDKKLMETIK